MESSEEHDCPCSTATLGCVGAIVENFAHIHTLQYAYPDTAKSGCATKSAK